MATTTNFGWETPDDTDLVKDGAAAMRTLGNAIDTSFVDLKGGTTGQILSKASNSDLDYAWITNDVGDITAVTAGTGISGGGTSGAVTITNDMATKIDAKGDLVVGTGADTYDRLAVGTNGHVLTADSSTATGLKWASASSVPNGYTLLNSPSGTTLTGAATITYSGISDQAALLIRVEGASSASASSSIYIRVNSDAGANYDVGFLTLSPSSTAFNNATGSTEIILADMSNNASSVVGGTVWMDGTNTTSFKALWANGNASSGGGSAQTGYAHGGIYRGTSAITSVSVISTVGNFDAGTLKVYGKAV